MPIRSGLFLPLFDELADPAAIAQLSAEAEHAGWDAVFVWDHVRRHEPVLAVADPWITLAAVAVATGRVRLGSMVRKERHMKAIIDGTVVAEAPEPDLISIEGNYYFPPSSISAGVLSDSPTPYTCPWKGVCQYHDISVDGSTHRDAAWSYPDPYPASFDRVGKDYTGYVAFDKQQITIVE